MKASKFFKLKAEWDSLKALSQPVIDVIAQIAEEANKEEPVAVSKTTKKKTTNEKQ
jgi:hypothetical protein